MIILRATRYPYSFSVTLDQRLNDLLIQECARLDVSKTEFFRDLLMSYFAQKGVTKGKGRKPMPGK